MNVGEFQALAQELKILNNLSNSVAAFIASVRFRNDRRRTRLQRFSHEPSDGPFIEVKNQLDELECEIFDSIDYVYKQIPGFPSILDDPLHLCFANDEFSAEIPTWEVALNQFLNRWNVFNTTSRQILQPFASQDRLDKFESALDIANDWMLDFMNIAQ